MSRSSSLSPLNRVRFCGAVVFRFGTTGRPLVDRSWKYTPHAESGVPKFACRAN
nr:hypothetical protein JVH1_4492 [Rhodococcus sp. JVH1]